MIYHQFWLTIDPACAVAVPCAALPPTLFSPPAHAVLLLMRHDHFADSADNNARPHDECAQLRAPLLRYIDHELDGVQANDVALVLRVKMHLSTCSTCARMEEQVQSMRLALAAIAARAQQRLIASREERVSAIVGEVRRLGC